MKLEMRMKIIKPQFAFEDEFTRCDFDEFFKKSKN